MMLRIALLSSKAYAIIKHSKSGGKIKLQNVNLEYYRLFYEVAKCGSLTHAAAHLSISQPAVSQSLKQLEGELSCKLFIRASKGIKLTKEGELLFPYAEQICAQADMGEKKLAQILNLASGEIRIGASDMTLQFFLLPYLEKFHEKYPAIQVKVSNAPTPETLDFLRTGNIDFGIISTPFTSHADLNVIEVREIEDIYVAGRKFIQYKNRMLELADLEKMPLIFLEGNTSTRKFMEEFLNKHDVNVKPEFELATSDMIVQFARRSLGIGCVMRDFAEQYIDDGTLFTLRFRTMIPRRKIAVVTDPRIPVSAAGGKLLDMIMADLK